MCVSGSKIVPYSLVLICVAVLAIGQILFKEFSLRLEKAGGFSQLSFADLAVFAVAGILYAASSVLWVIALRSVPLSIAYPFMALGYILVPLAALVFYGEHLNLRYFLGAFLIMLGLVVTTFPGANQ